MDKEIDMPDKHKPKCPNCGSTNAINKSNVTIQGDHHNWNSSFECGDYCGEVWRQIVARVPDTYATRPREDGAKPRTKAEEFYARNKKLREEAHEMRTRGEEKLRLFDDFGVVILEICDDLSIEWRSRCTSMESSIKGARFILDQLALSNTKRQSRYGICEECSAAFTVSSTDFLNKDSPWLCVCPSCGMKRELSP